MLGLIFLAEEIFTWSLPFGGLIGGAGWEVVWPFASLCETFESSRRLTEESFLTVSDPSLESALGVRGGVFFERGEEPPSVSLKDLRFEVKEEDAENGGTL